MGGDKNVSKGKLAKSQNHNHMISSMKSGRKGPQNNESSYERKSQKNSLKKDTKITQAKRGKSP
jgi:hypothetical protein